MPDLPIVAEGENARGERWYLKAGGSPEDYYTMLETLHPDGRRDEGGMGGAPLYPGSRYNSYVGWADDGLLRVIVRTDPQVRRLRLSIRATRDETLDLSPLAEDPEAGLAFFATLLPQPAELLSIQGFGDDGEPLPDPALASDPRPLPATPDRQPREITAEELAWSQAGRAWPNGHARRSWHTYQPRARHSSRCGRSAPSVVSPPWPG